MFFKNLYIHLKKKYQIKKIFENTIFTGKVNKME